LTLKPGQTVGRIYPAGFYLTNDTELDLVLSNPTGGELTGLTTASFSGSVPAPQLSLAVPSTSRPMVRIEDGPFVRLSGPSAATVSVEYQFEAGGEILEAGLVTFEPLETLHQIILTNTAPYDYELIQLTLGNAEGAPMSGITSVSFVNPPLTLGLSVDDDQQNLAAFAGGVPVGLSRPASSAGVSVDFQIEGGGGVLTNGTLSFGGGESAKSILGTTVDTGAHDIVRVSLSNPVRATFSGLTQVYYVRTALAPPLTNVTLIARGADWKYLDTGENAGTVWRTAAYSDSGWASGPAELGYGDGDEATVVGYGPDPNNRYITTYFRHSFTVADAGVYTNLNLWLEYDDGVVVYLNGTQIYRTPNMPATFDYRTTTTSNAETETTQTGIASYLQSGQNLVAVEIHQGNVTSSDISFNLELIGIPAPLPPPPQELYLGQFDGGWVLAWGDPTFVIQAADDLAGPWRLMFGLRTPAVLDTSAGQKFYRLYRP